MNETTNTLAARYVLLPTLLLLVALLGGVRVDATTKALVFVAPPLISLILAALLASLFVRGRLIEVERWFSQKYSLLKNTAHALTIGALFFASAQAFNSVLPERGLMNWLLSFFFLWTLWNNQFSNFDARRLLKSLAAMFGAAFFIKHFVLASLYTPDGGILKRLLSMLFEGITFGTLDAPAFAPASGYISFFALAIFAAALLLLLAVAPHEQDAQDAATRQVTRESRRLDTRSTLTPQRTPQLLATDSAAHRATESATQRELESGSQPAPVVAATPNVTRQFSPSDMAEIRAARTQTAADTFDPEATVSGFDPEQTLDLRAANTRPLLASLQDDINKAHTRVKHDDADNDATDNGDDLGEVTIVPRRGV